MVLGFGLIVICNSQFKEIHNRYVGFKYVICYSSQEGGKGSIFWGGPVLPGNYIPKHNGIIDFN